MIKQLIYRLSTKLQRPTIAGIDALHKRLDAIDSVQAQLSQALEGMEKYNSSKLSLMSEQIEQNLDISKSERDRIDFLHEQLIAARDTIGYKKAFDKNPLVTVRIATYNKADELLDVCLPSVLGQTYKNIEIIIVGDHCTDDTEARLKKLKDPRISFVNLPFRSIYPDNKNFRWMVAGSPGMN
ncbi:glycosyltransferase, partial [Candidatus Nomurabacteria bacterium]|nr:glycosyltransferase [Candidatus Nomurabacteria bacterium]